MNGCCTSVVAPVRDVARDVVATPRAASAQASPRTFLGVSALLFAASAALTIVW